MFETKFAPAERLEGEALEQQIAHFKGMIDSLSILDAIPDSTVILNSHRQIVYANRLFEEFVNTEASQFLGKRLGEILSCEHNAFGSGGCGTSEFCSVCGAVNAMIRTIDHNEVSQKECRLSTVNLDSYEFEVKSTPYHTEIGDFVFFSLRDVSEQKRREYMEQVFCHDLLNTASGMHGIAELMEYGERTAEFTEIVINIADELVDEIKSHQTLSAAEQGELSIETEAVESAEVLKTLEEVFAKHEVAKGKTLKTLMFGDSCIFKTDPVLLKRVLINLVKNAFEASGEETIVALSVRKEGNQLIFEVHNNGYIERNVQLQIFKRSFSTKGTGRGLGTYSIRLFGEKYLGGKVSFVSDKNDGTTFAIAIPIE